jgi:hypothetical protein
LGAEFAALHVHQDQQINIRFRISVASGFGTKKHYSQDAIAELPADPGDVFGDSPSLS